MSISGKANLKIVLEKLQSKSIEGAMQGISKSLMEIQVSAKRHVPKNNGELMNSIHIDLETEESKISGKVYTTNDHAIFVEFGTGPVGKASHKEIPPGVALQYKDKGWLIPVEYFPDYAKYGLTPIVIKGKEFIPTRGQRAQQYMTPASKKGKRNTKKLVAKEISKSLKELKK